MAAQWNPVNLRQAMTDRMSADEVEGLCFDLGVDYENLAGDTKSGKIRELIMYMQRHSRFDELTAQLAKERPDITPPGGSPAEAPAQPEVGTPSSQPGGQTGPTSPGTTTPPPNVAGPTWNYLDFDVAVEPAASGYTVNVLASPAGQARAATQVVLTDGPIADGVKALRAARFDVSLAKNLGSQLLADLLTGDVAKAYDRTLGRAESQGSGVRLRLRINAPELKALPWEYLYDTQRDNFLAVRRDVVISRYLEVAQGVAPLTSPPALRILVLLSSPAAVGLDKLDLDGEEMRIRDALAPLVTNGRVVLEVEKNPTSFNIRDRLWNNTYHIIHYSGHAYYASEDKDVLDQPVTKDTGYVVLPDDDGNARFLDEAAFAQFFVGNPSIRLIVLNACRGGQTSLSEYLSGLGDKLVQTAGVPAVIAMQFPIADSAAKTFAREFYTSLAGGQPIDAAVARSRLALYMDRGANDRAWATPVLFMRAADGRLFS